MNNPTLPDFYGITGEVKKPLKVFKLFEDTYLAEFEQFLAIAKVNEKGEIVRVSTFGHKEAK